MKNGFALLNPQKKNTPNLQKKKLLTPVTEKQLK